MGTPIDRRLEKLLALSDKRGMVVEAVRIAIGAKDFDIHAIRYAAASEIASIPGMTTEHVQAITGHTSLAMAKLYAGPAMQRARATEAQTARNSKQEKK